MPNQFTSNPAIPPISDTAIRAILTLVVVLVALIAGPLLARHSSRFPVVVEAVRERNGRALRREVAERGHRSKWIGRITLLSVWLAAVVSIIFIWLVGQGNARIPVDIWLANASDLGVRFGISLLVLSGVARLFRTKPT